MSFISRSDSHVSYMSYRTYASNAAAFSLIKKPVQNLARLLHFVERNPFINGVGLGDVAGAEDDGGDAGVGDGRGVGAIGHRMHLVRLSHRVDGTPQTLDKR